MRTLKTWNEDRRTPGHRCSKQLLLFYGTWLFDFMRRLNRVQVFKFRSSWRGRPALLIALKYAVFMVGHKSLSSHDVVFTETRWAGFGTLAESHLLTAFSVKLNIIGFHFILNPILNQFVLIRKINPKNIVKWNFATSETVSGSALQLFNATTNLYTFLLWSCSSCIFQNGIKLLIVSVSCRIDSYPWRLWS